MTYCANEYREPVTFDDVGINKKNNVQCFDQFGYSWLISGNTSRTLSSATTLSGHITEGSMLQT